MMMPTSIHSSHSLALSIRTAILSRLSEMILHCRPIAEISMTRLPVKPPLDENAENLKLDHTENICAIQAK